MLAGSFRLVASRLIPRPHRRKQALLLAVCILAGCAGSGNGKTQPVAGHGFRFMAPAGWSVRQGGTVVTVRHRDEFVQVAAFPLIHPYRPSLYAAVAKELRARMAEVARGVGGTVEGAGSVTAGGMRAHVYRVSSAGHVDEY